MEFGPQIHWTYMRFAHQIALGSFENPSPHYYCKFHSKSPLTHPIFHESLHKELSCLPMLVSQREQSWVCLGIVHCHNSVFPGRVSACRLLFVVTLIFLKGCVTDPKLSIFLFSNIGGTCIIYWSEHGARSHKLRSCNAAAGSLCVRLIKLLKSESNLGIMWINKCLSHRTLW